MRRLTLSLVLAAGSAVLLFVAVLASAQQTSPDRWPGPVVRVADRSGWDATVKRAVEQWNAAHVGIRFRLVGPDDEAEVHVVSDRERLDGYCRPRGCEAFASTVGPSRRHRTDVVLGRPVGYERTRPTAADVRLLVHELGHALGLQHARNKRCAVMLPDVALAGCGARGGSADDEGPPLCGPFTSDVEAASRLYGGRGRAQPYCVRRLGG
jgi:predicted Zn-dependent protease